MLLDSSTGQLREVDILIEGKMPGVPIPIRIGIECRDHKSPQDVTWIEQAYAKYQHLPLDLLVLASSVGFTKQARTKAAHLKITLWQPETLEDDASREIVGKLNSLWAKRLSYEPADMAFQAILETPEGERVESAELSGLLSHELVDSDGAPLAGIHDVVSTVISSQQDSEYLRDAKSGPVTIDVNAPEFSLTRTTDGLAITAHAYVMGQPERRYRIRSLQAKVSAQVTVVEVPLEHRRLADTPYSYGRADVDGNGVMIVVTEPEGQPPQVLIGPYEGPK
ncbi:hypothetical protein [Promicromonospora sp. NFX87]|uniref:hypothetical protein n=1 Tax=Promicromonospora sp. NFX87 TaxID=3402691 RepID=UPI003AFADC81